MSSSTSNSDNAGSDPGSAYPPPAEAIHGLWLPPGGDLGGREFLGDRTFWALVALAVTVVAIGVVRTDTRFAGAPKWYWMEKLLWNADADVVVAGDSRVYRGIDPSAFHGTTGTVRNFGFSSAKLTREYLDHAASLLSPQGDRTLILGVTPFTLCYGARDNDGFPQAQKDLARLRLPMRAARALEDWETWFRPVALDAWVGEPGRVRAMASDYAQVFHENGWVESDRIVEDPVASGLAILRQAFPGGPSGSADLSVLVAFVQELKGRGVDVFAFRPPVPPEVAALEDSLGFLDYASLAEQIRAAGGEWLDVDWVGLRSYDGSHIDGVSAVEFSKRLAASMERSRR